MPFYFYNDERLMTLVEKLGELRYRDMVDIPELWFYEDRDELVRGEKQGEPVSVGKGFRWKGWNRYNWICTSVRIPEHREGMKPIGLFDFKVPAGTGNNSHFESMLLINDEMWQGVDGNHKEVFFAENMTGQTAELSFRVWSGLSGGGIPVDMAMEIERAQTGWLDEGADRLYFLARNILETYKITDSGNPDREWMLNLLNRAFQMIEFAGGDQEKCCADCRKALHFLECELEGRSKMDVDITLIGHTHIDMAWLWQLKHTREKAARSFSTVNRLMEQYEDYQFMQSQAQLYEYVKEDFPELYEHIQKRVEEGRWEPQGAMWVECDCNLVSGESLVRQILLGKKFFKNEFGVDNRFLWLPDVFGYSWALPQILKKSGVHTFVTSKISWNDTNKLPYDTFCWRGLDGSEVLTHFITTPDDEASSYTYNGNTKPHAVKGTWDNYSNKDLNTGLMIPYGYGDGGGGPTRDMLETKRCLDKMPGIPRIKEETAAEYYDGLLKTAAENKRGGYLPVWDGELYLEFHRGTYTSHAYNKKMNRKLEYALRKAEILGVMAELEAGAVYNGERIEVLWKQILCQQFHDILPGSSIKEVYDDSREVYENAAAETDALIKTAMEVLSVPEEHAYLCFHAAPWKQSTYVKLEGAEPLGVYINEQGEVLPSGTVDGEVWIYVEDMAPMSFFVIRKSEQSKEVPAVRVQKDGGVSSVHYDVEWNSSGHLTRLYDKKAGRNVLIPGQCGNVLQVMEDIPRCFDGWEIESTLEEKTELIRDCREISVQENDLGIFVTFTWEYRSSAIRQVMCLYHEKRRIDFKTEIDWHEQQRFVKAAFPVEVRAVDARFDIQYGNIRRPVTRNTSWEAAKFEVVAHKWADIYETGYGVAVLNDCKYGYDIKDQCIRISLLKSAVDPDYASDQGRHTFTYALLPHEAEWYEADVEQEGYDLNDPVCVYPDRSSPTVQEMMAVDSRNVFIDCLKKEEDGDAVILRIHEFAGGRERITVNPGFALSRWQECDLMEQPESELHDGEIILDMKPYEIRTIKLYR